MVSVDIEHHVYLHTNFWGHLLYQATKQQLKYLNGEKWDAELNRLSVFVFSSSKHWIHGQDNNRQVVYLTISFFIVFHRLAVV